uniref:DAN domain-containing protein n=1 Tax=Romanomermis culicivorax TaxID=13658 RepID=A0A915J6X6_ROMCU
AKKCVKRKFTEIHKQDGCRSKKPVKKAICLGQCFELYNNNNDKNLTALQREEKMCCKPVKSHIWSTGCVFGEMLLGKAMFTGESGVDLLVEIIKVLGTPDADQLTAMNPNFSTFQFPKVRSQPLHKLKNEKN